MYFEMKMFCDSENILLVKGDVAAAECSYCKDSFEAEIVSCHEKICLSKPTKCSKCSSVILLQNSYDHECHASRAEGIIYTSTELFTQKIIC